MVIVTCQSQCISDVCICCAYSIAENKLYVTTQAVNRTARLAIVLELNTGSRTDTKRVFEYRSNPVFNDITPRSHLTV